jgi:hypothetical protein
VARGRKITPCPATDCSTSAPSPSSPGCRSTRSVTTTRSTCSAPSDEFFLSNIHDGADDPFRAGRANFGFLVDDLDAVHKRAIAAGGTEIAAPHDATGMPRCSAVVDPANNLLNLYQNA